MKKSTLIIGSLIIGTSFLFSSCEKAKEEASLSSVKSSSSKEGATIQLEESDYDKSIDVALEKDHESGCYTKGEITYFKGDKELGKFNFGDGKKDYIGEKDIKGKKEYVDLYKGKDNTGFDKKVIMPLVKTDDCKFIVEGIINYYKEGTLVATVDYGNGTCDDLATKSWPASSYGNKSWDAGSEEFHLSDYYGKK